MEEKDFNEERAHKKLERMVLVIFTVFMMSMFASAWILKWSVIAKEIIILTVASSWFIHIKQFKNYEFRAKYYAVMLWTDFLVYVFYPHEFTSMLCTLLAMIALLGLFCIPQIVYMGVVVTTFVYLYDGLILRVMDLSDLNGILRVILHIITGYAVSGIILLMIRNQQAAKEQLMENIQELKIAEQGKDDFMANISHEIRTPVNAVCGMSEAILQEDLPMDVRRDVIDIQTAGRNLLSTVSNMLDFSELASGKMALAEETYNITSTITDIINMALTFDNGKHLELIVDCDADLPSNLLGDEQKLRRVVINLLDNAFKFTKEGGVILRISSRKEEYGINLIVSVKDSGIGIERKDMERIFTSFSQVDSKRNREEGGIGLGLAITQALVSSMGGFMTVRSLPGIGSEFKFAVPQKVLDETPIVSIKNRSHLFAACYFNLDKYNYSIVREGYEKCIGHIAEQFGIMFRVCKNLPELKRRMEREHFTHIFISWTEYCEDRKLFEELAKEMTVVLILDYGQETLLGSNMLRIYKPFTVLSIAAVFNGQKMIQTEEQHLALHHRFIAPEANVLVVDDNVMNLKVMARLLLPYQIKVTMAGGGQEALDKLDSMDFDCVFLDHMMPEMDGVETLHKIRQKQGLYFQSLKVIAFTANAIGGAREMFLSEGFDDFIAKPIELSVLERMLRRYIPTQKQILVKEEDMVDTRTAKKEQQSHTKQNSEGKIESASISQQPAEKETESESEAKALADLSLAGIDIQQGMAYCGDKDGLREIMTVYHEEAPNRKKKLEEYFKKCDWKNYVITVHALKSNSKGIGANELSEMALNLEMAGKENRIDYILENHEEMMEKHEELLEVMANNTFLYPEGYQSLEIEEAGEIEAKLPEDAIKDSDEQTGKQGENLQETSEQSVKENLVLLKEKLDSFENDGIDDVINKLAACRYQGEELAGLMEDVRNKVNDFDFIGAADALSSWEERLGEQV